MIRVAVAICLLSRIAAAEGDPIARLAPAWTEHSDVVAAAFEGGQAAMVTPRSFAVYDLADGYASEPVNIPEAAFAIAIDAKRIVTATSQRAVILAWKRTKLESTPESLWSFDSPSEVLEVFAVDDYRAYGVLFDPGRLKRRRLVALSLATGKQQWNLELPANGVPELLDASGSRGIVAGHLENDQDHLGDPTVTFAIGFERVTGAQMWTYRGAQSVTMAANHRSLLIAREDNVTTVDRFTGNALDTELPVRFTPQIAASEEVAILAGSNADGGVVVAFDLATRRVRQIDGAPVMSDTPIAIAGGIVYLESPSGVIRAIDRFTGSHRWEWSAGERVRLIAHGDRLLIAASDEVRVLAPGVPPPLQEATIRGKADVECRQAEPLDIVVGDTPVHTAADGTYAVKIRGRGTIGIRFADQDLTSGGARVTLDGRTRYHAPVLSSSMCSGD